MPSSSKQARIESNANLSENTWRSLEKGCKPCLAAKAECIVDFDKGRIAKCTNCRNNNRSECKPHFDDETAAKYKDKIEKEAKKRKQPETDTKQTEIFASMDTIRLLAHDMQKSESKELRDYIKQQIEKETWKVEGLFDDEN